MRTIRAFFSWLTREGFLEVNPFASVKPPAAPRKIVATFTTDQVTALLGAIPANTAKGYRDLAILLTLYGTGLRLGELLALKTADIDFSRGQIKVTGKGAKERLVYASPKVFKVLYKYQNKWRPDVPSDYFLIDTDGKPFDRFLIAHRMKTYAEQAGIKLQRCSPHVLRHSFAVQFLRNGGDLFTLQRILGHATLDMTRHYAELSDQDIETKQKKYSPAELVAVRV